MNPSDRDPLEVELLVDADKRRVTIAEVQDFRESIASNDERFDEIDNLLDDEIQVDPYDGDPPSKRKDSELNRVLSILDSLERGDG